MDNTALLIIDFINDIVHPDGKIATAASFIKANKVIENVNQAIKLARKKNILIVFVKVGFSLHYLECPKESPVFSNIKQLRALQLNTWGTNFHEELDVLAQDIVVIKHRISAFYATSLEVILRTNHVSRLLISGVSTNMTVASTAREAHDRDYRVLIVEDACAAATEEIQKNSLELLSRVAKIIKVSALNSSLTR